MPNQRSDKPGGRGRAQPIADLPTDTEAEYDTSSAAAEATARGVRPRSTDRLAGVGSDTGPHSGHRPPLPDRNPSGRSGADSGAGSHRKTGMAEGDLDPATGGLGETGTADSASPSRSRVRTRVYGTDTEPLAGGAARPKPRR